MCLMGCLSSVSHDTPIALQACRSKLVRPSIGACCLVLAAGPSFSSVSAFSILRRSVSVTRVSWPQSARTSLLARGSPTIRGALGAVPSLRNMATVGAADGLQSKVKLGLCQISVGDDKEANIRNAKAALEAAAKEGAHIISLPECWNSPYATSSFPVYAEKIPTSADQVNADESPSVSMLIHAAKDLGVLLIGGSIPETDNGNVYNTCIIAGPDGQILAKHRKVHLFDIDVPGRITFKESDTLSAGDCVTVVDTSHGKVGVGICYDIRFPELSMLMRRKGCRLLIFPGAFNLTTGPAHWELLQRARAVDNQVFVAAVSPARVPGSSYQAWGHTSVVNPWGEVVATTGHEPALVIAEVDLDSVEEVRRNIPVSMQKRDDLYALKDVKEG